MLLNKTKVLIEYYRDISKPEDTEVTNIKYHEHRPLMNFSFGAKKFNPGYTVSDNDDQTLKQGLLSSKNSFFMKEAKKDRKKIRITIDDLEYRIIDITDYNLLSGIECFIKEGTWLN